MEQQKLPNSTLILVFGIISIVSCCCYGIVGLIFSIIALVLASKAKALYIQNPELYTGYSNVTTGKVLAIIGIVLNLVTLAYVIFMFVYFGYEDMQDPELMKERLEELLQ